jgi:deazaflavin-dependent oxidoreductase (nitroreductase family)
MPDNAINGIPRVDPRAHRAAWKSGLAKLVATKAGAAVHRTLAAPLDAAIMKLTGGRANSSAGAMPMVVLTSTGARSGQRRETPLGYFTDGDDVIVIASNYGGQRHPGWYHNLIAHPECELHIGRRGGPFTAYETNAEDRDRLFGLAVDFYPGYAKYAERTDNIRTIRILRLTPR